MSDINTVSLSGVLAGDVEMAKAKGISVARFFIDVEGAGDQRASGNFKVVAFDEWADIAKKLLKGDKVVLVGALLERRGRGRREMEIRVRNLIPLPQEEPQLELKVTKLDKGSAVEKTEQGTEKQTPQ